MSIMTFVQESCWTQNDAHHGLLPQVSTAEADNVRLAGYVADLSAALEDKEAARRLVESRSVDLQQKLTAAEREISQLKATLPAQVIFSILCWPATFALCLAFPWLLRHALLMHASIQAAHTAGVYCLGDILLLL